MTSLSRWLIPALCASCLSSPASLAPSSPDHLRLKHHCPHPCPGSQLATVLSSGESRLHPLAYEGARKGLPPAGFPGDRRAGLWSKPPSLGTSPSVSSLLSEAQGGLSLQDLVSEVGVPPSINRHVSVADSGPVHSTTTSSWLTPAY